MTLSKPNLEPMIAVYGEVIAARRYEAWDSHSRDHSWPAYKDLDPTVAEGIYLEDGRADAEALLPYVMELVEVASLQAAAAALSGAARRLRETDLLSDEAADALLAIGDAYAEAIEGQE